MLVEKGLHVFLLVSPFLMIPLTFSDRHHRQVRNTLQVLPLLLHSLLSLPHEVQELDGLGLVWIRLSAGELLSGQPTSMAMPVTAMKLVSGLAGSIIAIQWQLSGLNAFLSQDEPGVKLGETAAHPGQPLICRAPGLGRFQGISTGDPGGEKTHGHGLTRPTIIGHSPRSRRLFAQVRQPGHIDSCRSWSGLSWRSGGR